MVHPSVVETGRVAIVTGAEKGIGHEICLSLARGGWRLALCVRPESRALADQLIAEELAGIEAKVFPVDLSSIRSVVEVVNVVERTYGRIDGAVNNAGVRYLRPILDVVEDEWDQIMAVNTKAPFFLCQEVGRRMIATGIRGSLVNIASQLGVVAARDRSLYCISKAAVIAATKALALEFARHGIVVNSVAPGSTNTAGAKLLTTELEATEFLQRMPIGRRVEPSEVAMAVSFLLGSGGGAITGQTLLVDGGWTLW